MRMIVDKATFIINPWGNRDSVYADGVKRHMATVTCIIHPDTVASDPGLPDELDFTITADTPDPPTMDDMDDEGWRNLCQQWVDSWMVEELKTMGLTCLPQPAIRSVIHTLAASGGDARPDAMHVIDCVMG